MLGAPDAFLALGSHGWSLGSVGGSGSSVGGGWMVGLGWVGNGGWMVGWMDGGSTGACCPAHPGTGLWAS